MREHIAQHQPPVRRRYRGVDAQPSSQSVGQNTEDQPDLTDERQRYHNAPTRRISAPEPDDVYTEDDGVDDGYTGFSTRLPRSAIKYATEPQRTEIRVHHHQPPPPRASALRTHTQEQRPIQAHTQEPQTVTEQKPRHHWMVPVGIGMLAMLVLWMLGSAILSWLQAKHDDLTYGYPRTYQTDAVVGHQDSPAHPSHFTAMNLNGSILVIEVQGGDTTKVRAIVGPTNLNSNGNLDPVTLQFKDVNGDGKPDMIITVHSAGGDDHTVYINDQGSFRPLRPGETIHL